MACYKCACENHREFDSEVCTFDFPSANCEGLRKPIVWAFPKLRVRLECGYADFSVPDTELRVLVTGVPYRRSIVLTRVKNVHMSYDVHNRPSRSDKPQNSVSSSPPPLPNRFTSPSLSI